VPQVFTEVARLAAEVRRAWESQTLRAVVAAGGDGTLALVVNRVPEGVPIVPFPLGNENLLAKHIAATANPRQTLQAIDGGQVVRLDAGLANGRLFLLMAGVGFDADVVRRLHERRTGHVRSLSYIRPILASIRHYRYPELRVHCESPDAQPPASSPAPASPNCAQLPEYCRQPVLHQPDAQAREVQSSPSLARRASVPLCAMRARWAFVCNVPPYAAGLQVVPDADGQDGLLDVCTFQKGSWWNGLRFFLGVLSRRHRHWADCGMYRTRRLRVESDVEVPYQLDGDPGGVLPLDVEVVPGRVTLLVSKPLATSPGR
jgi:diacylglycerol kinase family enzyme